MMVGSNGQSSDPVGDALGQRLRNAGKSVATMWGEMVAAAEQGEVCEIANKHGQVVAVMVGIGEWEGLQQRVIELEGRVGEIEAGEEG